MRPKLLLIVRVFLGFGGSAKCLQMSSKYYNKSV